MIINFRCREVIFYSNNFSKKEVRILANVAFPSGIKSPETGEQIRELPNIIGKLMQDSLVCMYFYGFTAKEVMGNRVRV